MTSKVKNSLFLNNFKGYGVPIEFINLARRKAFPSVVYLILLTVLSTFLCFVLPFNSTMNKGLTFVSEGAQKYMPEFTFAKGELSVTNDKKYDFLKENNLPDASNQLILLADTSLDYFTIQSDGPESVYTYMTEQQIEQFATGQGVAIFLAKKNMVMINRGQLQMYNYLQLIDSASINVVRMDRESLLQMIPIWWQSFVRIADIVLVLFFVVNLFFMGLIYTIVAKIVDSIIHCRIPFGKMYLAVMFIYWPWHAFMLLLSVLIKGQLFQTLSPFISFAFMLTYIILTLVSFGKKEGMYSNKIVDTVYIQPDNDDLVLVPGIKSQYDDNFSTKPFMPSDYEIENAANFTGAPNEYRANEKDTDRVQRTEEEEWKDIATDYAQNEEFASKSLVWKPETDKDGEMVQAETSQQWRPQATETDEEYRARKKEWARYNKVWGKDTVK